MTCRARRDIALKLSLTPRGLQSSALGMAQPMARVGLNVRIFDGRVREEARRRNRQYSPVLAHAIAHEIGHALLRCNSHDMRGLMANVWSDQEYQRMEHGLMFFTKEQSRKMQATLTNKACTSGQLEVDRL